MFCIWIEISCKFKANQGLAFLRDKYLVLRLIGKGGFGEVYEAYDVEKLRKVACKVTQLNSMWGLQTLEHFRKNLFRENLAHTTLLHKNIVKLYDHFQLEDQNTFCTVLEYCDGLDLDQHLKQREINEKEAKYIIRQIMTGLKYLHSQKVIHYDLKPQNIIFHQGEIKISDFGMCKIMEENQTRLELTSQGGTYWYLPPECFDISRKPEISQKVDIWSLGVIFYQLVFNKKPLGEGFSQSEYLKNHIRSNANIIEFPIQPIISSECKEFIKKCLTYSAKDRPDISSLFRSKYFNR